jgi:hypothetical protein
MFMSVYFAGEQFAINQDKILEVFVDGNRCGALRNVFWGSIAVLPTGRSK